jgi:hypothetical protein
MTHYVDLSRCGRHSVRHWTLLSIGWLDDQQPFLRGASAPEFLDRLAALASVDQPELYRAAGYHSCNVDSCRDADIHGVFEPRLPWLLGSREIFVPSTVRHSVVYCAPDLILHYVQGHGYAPPAEFVTAVMATRPDDVPHLEEIDQDE